MADGIIPLIAGNWKMNGLSASMAEVEKLAELLAAGDRPNCFVAICPPATLLSQMSARGATAGIATGGQDCHPKTGGAHTGDVSAAMLADAGAKYVIVGHSERRTDHKEDDALVRAKALAALTAGLTPIICVGETRAEREAAMRQLVGEIEASIHAQVYVLLSAADRAAVEVLESEAERQTFLRARLGDVEARITWAMSEFRRDWLAAHAATPR